MAINYSGIPKNFSIPKLSIRVSNWLIYFFFLQICVFGPQKNLVWFYFLCIILFDIIIKISVSFIKIFKCYFEYTQELVSAKNGSRLKKRLCIALAVLCVVGLCVAGLVYYGAIKPGAAKSKSGETEIGNPVTLNDILEGKFYAKHNNASWISDTLLFYRDSAVRFYCTFVIK